MLGSGATKGETFKSCRPVLHLICPAALHQDQLCLEFDDAVCLRFRLQHVHHQVGLSGGGRRQLSTVLAREVRHGGTLKLR